MNIWVKASCHKLDRGWNHGVLIADRYRKLKSMSAVRTVGRTANPRRPALDVVLGYHRGSDYVPITHSAYECLYLVWF